MSEVLSKEIIKSRMFKHAASYWQYNDTDIDSFDPIVKLLIEACAVEMYKVHTEITNSNVKVLDKLASLLTPDVMVSPRPAHAIIHAKPLDANLFVNPAIQLYHQKKVASKPNGPLDSNLDIYFSSTGIYKLFNSKVKYLANNDNLYFVNEQLNKEFFINTSQYKNIKPNTLWIGLELNDKVEELNHLSFYFDWKNINNKDEYFKLLEDSKWYLGDKLLKTKKGSSYQFYNKTHFTDPDEEFELVNVIELEANKYYENRFITIDNYNDTYGNLADLKQQWPTDFENYFDRKELGKIDGKVLWFRVELGARFDNVLLNDLSVQTNCFPICNRKMNEVRYRLQNQVNIVPLLSEEPFLAIKNVYGLNNNEYSQSKGTIDNKNLPGTFTIREGGVERFDTRNAKEYLEYLIELLRDESSSFSAFGADFISSIIKDLNQNIALIEQKLKQNINQIKNTPAYLFITPHTEGENIFVQYWNTLGADANNIRQGTKMELYLGTELDRNSILLLSNTFSGRNKLDAQQKLDAYKYALTTRNRIVTLEDIKSYCWKELGSKITEVNIQKGLAISPMPNEGIIATLDVYLQANNETINPDDDLEAELSKLQIGLHENSVTDYNFRVFLNREN